MAERSFADLVKVVAKMGYTALEKHVKKHRVFIAIQNNTDFTLERTGEHVHHGQWEVKESWVYPPEKIAPKQGCILLALTKGAGDKIEVEVKYKKAGDDKELFKIYVYCPFTGANDYGDTGLRDWARNPYVLNENGDFRWNIKGAASVTVNAGFVLDKNPYPNQAKDSILPGYTKESPSAVVFDNKIYVFYQGQHENRLWYTVYEDVGGNQWKWRKDHTEDCMRLNASPSAVVFKDKIYVFHQGTDGRMWYNSMNPRDGPWGKWGSDREVKNVGMSASPSAAVYDGKIHVAHQGYNLNGTTFAFTFDGDQGFSKDKEIDGAKCSQSPALVLYQDRLLCFHQGPGHDGTLHSAEYNKKESIFDNRKMISNMALNYAPSAIEADGKLYVFHKAHGAGFRLWCNRYDGKDWSGEVEFSDVEMENSPNAIVFGNSIWVFHQGGSGLRQIWAKTIGFK
jgi:hypothetical protein